MSPYELAARIQSLPVLNMMLIVLGPVAVILWLRHLALQAKAQYTHPDAPLFAVIEGVAFLIVVIATALHRVGV